MDVSMMVQSVLMLFSIEYSALIHSLAALPKSAANFGSRASRVM